MIISTSTLTFTSPLRFGIPNPLSNSKYAFHFPSFTISCFNSLSHCTKMVDQFDPLIPLHSALTPPSSWYTDSSFFDFELHRVFYSGWQAVGLFSFFLLTFYGIPILITTLLQSQDTMNRWRILGIFSLEGLSNCFINGFAYLIRLCGSFLK